ncbi:P-loop NTPase [Bdellovibrio bacteriovorus]|uniref:P-loop NTPase n=1 Tax=Bdellovibrio bacteriovorus TaxID=959 RepID=UPI0035A726E6
MDKAVLEFKPTHANKDHDTKLWVVASGKGGVGKTFVSSSLGMTLSKLGHSVVIVDLDLSGSNIHTVLGLNPSHMNIRHYFEGAKTLQELVIPTPYPHLSYVQGFWDAWTPTDFFPQPDSKPDPAVEKPARGLCDRGPGRWRFGSSPGAVQSR